MVHLMNVALFIHDATTLTRFIQVSKKCLSAVRSLHTNTWIDQKVQSLFVSCETIVFSSLESAQTVPPSVKAISFHTPPSLAAVPSTMAPFVTSGIGFADSIHRFSRLESFYLEIPYNFLDPRSIHNQVISLDWDGILSLPHIHTIYIHFVELSTPIPLDSETLEAFYTIFVELIARIQRLSKRKCIIVLVLYECTSQVFDLFSGLSDVFIQTYKEDITTSVDVLKIRSLLLSSSVVRKMINIEFSCMMQDSIIRIANDYYIQSLNIYPTRIKLLSPNDSSESEDSMIGDATELDLSPLESLKQLRLYTLCPCVLTIPPNLVNLETNAECNLQDASLFSLTLSSCKVTNFNLPSTLESLTLMSADMETLFCPSHLTFLQCKNCTSLTSIENTNSIHSLILDDCNSLNSLEIPPHLQSISLQNTGITSVILPTSITFICIDPSINLQPPLPAIPNSYIQSTTQPNNNTKNAMFTR